MFEIFNIIWGRGFDFFGGFCKTGKNRYTAVDNSPSEPLCLRTKNEGPRDVLNHILLTYFILFLK